MTTQSRLMAHLLMAFCLCALALPVSADPDGYWFDRADLPTQRQEILPGALDGKILVTGGWLNGSSITDVVEIYDPTTDSWTTGPPLPFPLHHNALATVDGVLYSIGGYYNLPWPWIAVNFVHAFDFTSNEWTQQASMNVARGEHAVAVHDGKIYVTGGNDLSGNATPFVEVYDPVADTWTLLSNIPTVRHHHASAAIDSLVYVVGGRQGYWGGPYTSVAALEAYSPASDTWYTLSDIPNPRGGLSTIAIDDKLYTFGGEIPGIFENTEEYDPATQIWRQLTPMLTPRHGTAAAMVGDTVYIIGGSRTEGMTTDNSNQGFVLGTCLDSDHDGFGDSDDPEHTCPVDNCPEIYNLGQEDFDGDLIGDPCDDDDDDDSVSDDVDNCLWNNNPGQEDNDSDGSGDACDNDDDDDGVDDTLDNCQFDYNPSQDDADSNGIGDACDGCCGQFTDGTTGNANCSEDGKLTLSDITLVIDNVFISKSPLCCHANGNTNASTDCKITLSDITILIDAVFISKEAPSECMPECET